MKKTGKRYRLPTEAEWEKGARGENGLIYPWGNEFDSSKANLKEAKIDNTSDVGTFSPGGDSPYGCADMIGNVWEWCADWFNENEYKNREGIIDPQGPSQGNLKVVRGGSFYRTKGVARCTTRTANELHLVGEAKGFRVALSPSILSSREKEVLLLIEKGLSNKQIANSLSLSQQTVKNHITSILKKFNVNNRKQAITYAHEKSLI